MNKGLGCLTLIGLFLAVVVLLPFSVFPSAGIGVALPVIYVPGEKLDTFSSGDFVFTNTMLAALITTLLVLGLLVPVASSLAMVPGRLQAFFEIIIEFWYNQAKQVAGVNGRQLVPLMLTIFFFVLIANLMKVIPGVDTVGEKHCAGIEAVEGDPESYIAFSGYELHNKDSFFAVLKNEQTLFTGDKMPYKQYKECKHRLHPEDHSEASSDHSESEGEDHSEAAAPAAEGESGEGEDHSGEGAEASEGTETEVATVQEGEQADDGYPTENKDHGAEYDRFSVTPFIRGATTDLTVTLSIALIAMIFVQVYGIATIGVGDWGSKFINLPALGNFDVMTFVVGLLETVLEIAKVVSFAFRLFGAMFAGQILMFVIVFLLGAFIPMIVILLEVFIGAIQAFVFTILFLMFASLAMVSHSHHDEEHGHEASH